MFFSKELNSTKELNQYNELIHTCPYGCYQHLTQYAETMRLNGYLEHRVLGFFEAENEGDEGKLIGGVSAPLKPIFKGLGYYCFLGRGFMIDYDNRALLEFSYEETVKWLKSLGVQYVRFDFPVERENTEFYKWLSEKGINLQPLDDENASHTFMPYKSVCKINKEDIYKGFSKKIVPLIKKSKEYGLIFREGTKDDIDTCYKLNVETEERDGFVLSSKEMFVKTVSGLIESGYGKLFIVELDKEKTGTVLTEQKNKWIAELEKIQARGSKKGAVESDIQGSIRKLDDMLGELAETNDENKVLCACLVIDAFEKTYYHYAFSSNHMRQLNPNYFMLSNIFERAVSLGHSTVDLGGTYKDKDHNLTAYKMRWGGETKVFSGELEKVLKKPIGSLLRYIMLKRRRRV